MAMTDGEKRLVECLGSGACRMESKTALELPTDPDVMMVRVSRQLAEAADIYTADGHRVSFVFRLLEDGTHMLIATRRGDTHPVWRALSGLLAAVKKVDIDPDTPVDVARALGVAEHAALEALAPDFEDHPEDADPQWGPQPEDETHGEVPGV